MPIPQEVLSELKCCFFNDGHIAIEPILASCGATGCKECITSSKMEEIECYSCKGKHSAIDLKNMPGINSIENIVKSFANDLIEYSNENLEKNTDLLKGNFRQASIKFNLFLNICLENALIEELNAKIESIENEMDLRVESLISSIHDYREECKKKLDTIKEDFKKLILTIENINY